MNFSSIFAKEGLGIFKRKHANIIIIIMIDDKKISALLKTTTKKIWLLAPSAIFMP